MATFGEHRILIASLFLPTSTAAFSNDSSNEHLIGNQSARVGGAGSPKSPKIPSYGSSKPNSIIDDLSVRSRASSPPATRKNDKNNPFASFASTLQSGRSPQISSIQMSSSDSETTLPPAGEAYRRLSRKQSRGPISISREPSVSRWEVETNPNANGGLYNAVKSVQHQMHPNGKLWVGIVGPETDDLGSEAKQSIEKKLAEHDSVPVWVSDADFSGCYDSFCHQVVSILKFEQFHFSIIPLQLWPSLHYIIPDAPKSQVTYESSSFAQYKAVNERFAEVIASLYKPGDVSEYL